MKSIILNSVKPNREESFTKLLRPLLLQWLLTIVYQKKLFLKPVSMFGLFLLWFIGLLLLLLLLLFLLLKKMSLLYFH
ncbi:hypothetical protein DPMN_046497 [Dreissena polymorpha]|uniref:Uncharacterized protein n=1 Tax=Dreissena polymorpha TaxID=45954 RepID=A0A9D4I0X5_DREPO|nr:hypothetical protein DPMN_046497 [Dreissena polymorpha]